MIVICMCQNMYNIPILLICFNRPDHVRRVLSEIRRQQPADLYVAQDGAREGNEYDEEKIQEVRDVVRDLVDWPCQVHTLYQERNLGCGPGPVAGISWFFEHEEMGIVMEDDCLPHPDFFGYCEELLLRYHPKTNPEARVGYISSTLYHDRWKCEASYGFSHYMITGAWAAWRETWQGFDIDLDRLNPRRFYRQVKKITGNKQEAHWWLDTVRVIQQDKNKKSYWDYQMQIHLFQHSLLTIHPQKNLVSNIGFDPEGTHTTADYGRGNRPVFPILPLAHPSEMKVDLAMDERCFAQNHSEGFVKDTISNLYYYLLRSKGLGHYLLKYYKSLKGSGYNSRWMH